jgi:hypothetical protein
MTYQEWPNLGRLLAKIGQIPAHDKPELARPRDINYNDLQCHRQVNLQNINRGFDETSSIKFSSGEK